MLDKVKRLLNIIAFALGVIFVVDIGILVAVVFFNVTFNFSQSIIPLSLAFAVVIPIGYLYIYSWIKTYKLKEYIRV